MFYSAIKEGKLLQTEVWICTSETHCRSVTSSYQRWPITHNLHKRCNISGESVAATSQHQQYQIHTLYVSSVCNHSAFSRECIPIARGNRLTVDKTPTTSHWDKSCLLSILKHAIIAPLPGTRLLSTHTYTCTHVHTHTHTQSLTHKEKDAISKKKKHKHHVG